MSQTVTGRKTENGGKYLQKLTGGSLQEQTACEATVATSQCCSSGMAEDSCSVLCPLNRVLLLCILILAINCACLSLHFAKYFFEHSYYFRCWLLSYILYLQASLVRWCHLLFLLISNDFSFQVVHRYAFIFSFLCLLFVYANVMHLCLSHFYHTMHID